ncbi:MAG: pantetheine-phosphate adenylyltransferase [Gemmatimonadaceae bacterium]
MPTIAVYAGSFDPITRGHEELVRRSTTFVDEIVLAITTNLSKEPLFSIDERMALAETTLGDVPGISIQCFDGLLADFARSIGASLIIRGLRAAGDFEYEFQMALMNRHLGPGIETVFMVPSVETTYISSTIVREVARYGGDLTGLVHPVVAAALCAKFAK